MATLTRPAMGNLATVGGQRTTNIRTPAPTHLRAAPAPATTSAISRRSVNPDSSIQGFSTRRRSPSPEAVVRTRFLELCVRTGRFTQALGEIDLSGNHSDGVIFERIKAKYLETRNNYHALSASSKHRRIFSLSALASRFLIPEGASFVKVRSNPGKRKRILKVLSSGLIYVHLWALWQTRLCRLRSKSEKVDIITSRAR